MLLASRDVRRLSTCVAGFAFVLLAAAPAAAQRTLVIERFEATIEVAPDGTIQVEETITPRFTGSWNGMYRSIPIQYRTPQGLNYTLRLDVQAITDGAGGALRYESDRERHYRKLKIFIPGAVDTAKTVVIRYRVNNGLRFSEEHDELYWNVTGDEWEVPIESASAVVRLPAGVSGVRATSFTGGYGSSEQATVAIDGPSVRVATTRGLSFREGLTVAIGWNPGVVHRPTAVEQTASTIYGNLPLLFPPLVFLGMFRLWRARGRDPELAPISTLYEPPDGMTPAELGTLVDGTPDMRDITATIVDLAVRGYVHISEMEDSGFFGMFSSKDYTFRLKKGHREWGTLKAHEQQLLAGMFGGLAEAEASVTMSDLKNKFYKNLPGIKEELKGMLVSRGYYTGRPDRVRALYIIGGVIAGGLVGAGSVAVLGSLGMQPVSGVVAGVATAIIIGVFGWFMPARTIRGTREYEKILGFQEFLSRVDADRLDRVVTTPGMFEKFLPYAMALGVEDNWAKAFEGINRQPPDWYSGAAGIHMFRASAFTSDLSRMSASAATVMASAPRSSGGSGFSSGGGFSGGGFGGGGGGGF